MSAYAKATSLMGRCGSGQLTKMVNQILIAGIVQGLSEGLNFAMKAGLDANQVIEVVKYGAAQSWQLENRGHTMVKGEFDFGFAIIVDFEEKHPDELTDALGVAVDADILAHDVLDGFDDAADVAHGAF